MYQVLYRKYRPQVFDDVVGQPQVTKVLAEQVISGRVSHAYLFTGSRGTGKTTCARIFSKAICCRAPKNGDPCGECEICRGIDNGSVLDYTEIDAASNRSIEDVRRIREEAWIAPSQAKYRIYVLDEVHMLTTEAFNALLKILEEPPEHVRFILATTDVQKLPGTILSRCQRFDFMRIEPQLISERLIKVAAAEDRRLTDAGAAMIAGMADGAMRDALSILDRCMSESGDIGEDTVAAVVGLVGKDALFALADAVCRGDSAEAIRLVNGFHRASCDSERLCGDLLMHFRNYMIVRVLKRPEQIVVCTAADMERYRRAAAVVPPEKLLFYIDVLSETAEKLKRSSNGVVDAETAILRLCRPSLSERETALLARIAALEEKVAALESRPAAAVPAAQIPASSDAPEPAVRVDDEPSPFEPTEDDPPLPLPFDAPAENEPPLPMPFDEPAEDEPPLPMPFDGPAEDDPPLPMPFDEPAEDDPPLPMPFDEPAEDDPPLPLPFDGPAEDEPPLPFDGPAEDEPPLPFDAPAEDDPPLPLPFDAPVENDPPLPMPFDAPGADAAETEVPQPRNTAAAAGPFGQWDAVCEEATKISGMFQCVLPGSSAWEIGDTLRLSSSLPTFNAILKGNKTLTDALKRAVRNVTGRDLHIEIV